MPAVNSRTFKVLEPANTVMTFRGHLKSYIFNVAYPPQCPSPVDDLASPNEYDFALYFRFDIPLSSGFMRIFDIKFLYCIILAMHSLAAVSRPRLSETEPNRFYGIVLIQLASCSFRCTLSLY